MKTDQRTALEIAIDCCDDVLCRDQVIDGEKLLHDDLGVDSLEMHELVVAVEDATGIHVTDAELGGWKSVDDIARLIEARGKLR